MFNFVLRSKFQNDFESLSLKHLEPFRLENRLVTKFNVPEKYRYLEGFGHYH